MNQIKIGDRVVVMNSYGLKVAGTVQSIREDYGSGRLIYRLISKDSALQVYARQIVASDAPNPMTMEKRQTAFATSNGWDHILLVDANVTL